LCVAFVVGGDRVNGYVLYARAMLDSTLWGAGPDALRVGTWLIMQARYNQTPKKYPGVTVERGDVLTSLSHIAAGCSWFENRAVREYSRAKVARIIDTLCSIGFCIRTSDTYGTHITICKYDYYQNPANYNSNSDDTTVIQQRTTPCTSEEGSKNGEEGKEQGSAGASVVLSEPTDIPDKYRGFLDPETVVAFHNEATGSNPSPEFLAAWRAAITELVALKADPDRLSAALAWYISPGATFRPKWPETRFLRADWFQALIAKHTAELGK
jgi:hypothetical protein